MSQGAGFVALGSSRSASAATSAALVRVGLAAGRGGGAGLAAFYRALSLGTMSVVSPHRRLRGGRAVRDRDRDGRAAVPRSRSSARRRARRRGAGVASTSGAPRPPLAPARSCSRSALPSRSGCSSTSSGLGSRDGDALSTLFGARVGSLSLLVLGARCIRAPLRLPRAALLPVAAVGLADVTANALFAAASSHGLLALVSVLGSLYPGDDGPARPRAPPRTPDPPPAARASRSRWAASRSIAAA